MWFTILWDEHGLPLLSTIFQVIFPQYQRFYIIYWFYIIYCSKGGFPIDLKVFSKHQNSKTSPVTLYFHFRFVISIDETTISNVKNIRWENSMCLGKQICKFSLKFTCRQEFTQKDFFLSEKRYCIFYKKWKLWCLMDQTAFHFSYSQYTPCSPRGNYNHTSLIELNVTNQMHINSIAALKKQHSSINNLNAQYITSTCGIRQNIYIYILLCCPFGFKIWKVGSVFSSFFCRMDLCSPWTKQEYALWQIIFGVRQCKFYYWLGI